ncbi:uncharacterized protein [Periplaneta americana]|uniref:uncharacterized protein n=1 Tax=Periplaneta americana TaxID=6978 RepID=UPI0037E78CB0
MNAFILLCFVGLVAGRATEPQPLRISVYEASEPSSRDHIGISGIREQPIIALIKAPNGLMAYMMERGLATLEANPTPSIGLVHEMLRSNNDNTALIFNPLTLANESPAWQQIRELPIARLEAPENTRVANMAKMSARETVPIVMFFEREDFASRNFEQVESLGEINIANPANPIN